MKMRMRKQSEMTIDQADYLRARERHERMRVEARILRLIRAEQQPAAAPTRQPVEPQAPRRRESLAGHVAALLRARATSRV
jgi:hypothetical protein